MEITLCLPDGMKSCFACCPPIRPAGYEHIQYAGSVRRILQENTRAFARRPSRPSPIRGWSCWALGYLDERYRLVGCLLHPARHGGEDRRWQVGYGGKCARETCPEALEFQRLTAGARGFWLHLAAGLDSFAYSSTSRNPLFRMLGWGADLLERLASQTSDPLCWPDLVRRYPVLATPLAPKAYAYLLGRVVRQGGVDALAAPCFRSRFEQAAAELKLRLGQETRTAEGAPYTYRLALERTFLDFLRLALGLTRLEPAQARWLKEEVDAEIRNRF